MAWLCQSNAQGTPRATIIPWQQAQGTTSKAMWSALRILTRPGPPELVRMVLEFLYPVGSTALGTEGLAPRGELLDT